MPTLVFGGTDGAASKAEAPQLRGYLWLRRLLSGRCGVAIPTFGGNEVASSAGGTRFAGAGCAFYL